MCLGLTRFRSPRDYPQVGTQPHWTFLTDGVLGKSRTDKELWRVLERLSEKKGVNEVELNLFPGIMSKRVPILLWTNNFGLVWFGLEEVS